MNSRLLVSLTLIIIIAISGCIQLTTVPPYIKFRNSPYLSETYSLPTNITKGENFKIYYTISNPTSKEFTPYVEFYYDTDVFDSAYVKNKEKIKLPDMPMNSIRHYYADFYSRNYYFIELKNYTINLTLYDSNFSTFDRVSIQVEITK